MNTLEKVPAIEDIESEVEERLEVFVRAYVSEFEKTVEEYAKEAEVGGTAKSGKIADKVVSPGAGAIGASAGALVLGAIGTSMPTAVEDHRKKEKKITQIFQTVKPDELRKMFVEAATLIYYSFQNIFDSVTDADGNWKRALSKLAIDARNRSISFITYNEETNIATEPLSKDLLTKALIMGESKYSFISHVSPEKMQQIIPATKPGYTVKSERNEWKTSDIYEKVGIKIVGSNGQTKYYQKQMCGNDYGHRWSFSWENNSSYISNYTEEGCPNVSEDPSLNLEELEAKMAQILTNINKDDPKWLVKDYKLQLASIKEGVDGSKETVETMQQDLNEIKTKLSLGLSKSDQPKVFNVTPPVKTFTGRERELTQLHEKLQTNQKQVVVAQCASISGLGVGKSELARKYAHTYHESYRSCIWIDSETQSSIEVSFRTLAYDLQILQPEPGSYGTKSHGSNLSFILGQIYKYFSGSKSLFVFDNVNQYEDIKDFLPPNLSPTYEKPTIIITSRNIDLDIGDEGDVELILLDQFTPEEALSFVKKVLEIEDEDKSRDTLISELTKELFCFPLALHQAASYIKVKKHLNSAIENYLADFREEKRKRLLMKYKPKHDRYTETTYITWQIIVRNVEKDEANGPLAMRLVEVMAYLAADNIPLTGFKELEENNNNLNEAVNILLKYSLITIKINDDRIRFVSYFEESFEENDEEKVLFANDANVHRLVQQVIRLWVQEEEREEDVLRTALTRVYDYIDHAAALWKYACNYTTLINNYFCETKSYNKLLAALNYLVIDGDTRTIRKILNYLESRKDLWREISYHILNVGFVECTHNDPNMENIGHATRIKTLVLFHAELFKALRQSNTKDLELFLQSFDKSLINSIFQNCTALGRSAHCGKLNVVKILIENGADVNSPSWMPQNNTALHVALIENHLKVVEYLLDHGADPNTTNRKGWTALELSCHLGYLNIVKRLIETIEKSENVTEVNWMPLYLAAQNNQVETVEFLTSHEVYRSAMNDRGQTVCRIAAEGGSIQVVKYMIDNKLANVNGRDCKNETLLTTAVNNNKFDIVKYLLSDETPDKANIDAYNVLGFTPFFQAVSHCNIEIARFLFEHGADVDNVRNGSTLLGQLNIFALHLAATCDLYLAIVKFLVEECNADINRGLNTSFSPLQVAKCFDNKEICEFLIRNGADTTEWNKANLDNITRIIRRFCQENNSAVDYMFSECTSILDYVKAYNEMHLYPPSRIKEPFETLHSCLKGLRLDICYDQGQQNQEFEQ